ncbi:MAG: universal stress protein [Chloroflexota bacterium]|nr:universal stress protein [Chloroflexota bacterium]
MKIMLCTNGFSHTARALDLGVRVARKTASAVDILVIAERDREKEALRMAEEAAGGLEATGVPVTLHRRTGRLADEVVNQAQAAPYDLIVIGSRGRRGIMRLLLGSVALHVTGHTPASVLVVKGRPHDLKRFLVNSSAGPMSEHTIRFSGRLAQPLGASVTLLHVMSQLPLAEDAVSRDLEASAEELIQRGSREGVHLSRMLTMLAAEGVTARAVVRHGLVRDEITAEAQEGRYDLLVTGAHVTPGLDARLVGDLSADILLAANRPVLVVHPQMNRVPIL